MAALLALMLLAGCLVFAVTRDEARPSAPVPGVQPMATAAFAAPAAATNAAPALLPGAPRPAPPRPAAQPPAALRGQAVVPAPALPPLPTRVVLAPEKPPRPAAAPAIGADEPPPPHAD